MNPELHAKIQQLDALEWELRTGAPSKPRDPVETFANHAVSSLAVRAAGEITGELFGRKRLGTGWARKELAAARAAQKKRAELERRQAHLRTLDHAEAIINGASQHLPPKTLVSLRRAAVDARHAARPATVASKTRAYIARSRVAIQGALELPTPAAMLHELEQGLRKLITRELATDPDWWKQRVPPDVRERAEARANGRKPLIDYVDFPDHLKIITQKNNWEGAFRRVFPNRDWINLRLVELAQPRNDIAHSRVLTYDEAMKFRVLSRDILARLGR